MAAIEALTLKAHRSTEIAVTNPIASSWLSRASTTIAPELIGCTLVREFANKSIVRGLIVETEAYTPDDPAMHAYRRKTTRNCVLFGAAGKTYVYQIYGIYHCLNIVTDQQGTASAVLIRALQLESVPTWVDLQEAKAHRIAAGPGKLCRTLQIDLSLNATPLEAGQPLWLEHRTPEFDQQVETNISLITQTTRIGLTRGTELPWRWYLRSCPAVSKKG